MKYEYESVTPGIFKFTIPGEHRTVELFNGSKVIVSQPLTGNYLRLLKLVREIPEEKPKTTPKTTSKPKAKVADKITAVKVTEEKPSEKAEVNTEDTVVEAVEVAEKPAPKRRGRKKRDS